MKAELAGTVVWPEPDLVVVETVDVVRPFNKVVVGPVDWVSGRSRQHVVWESPYARWVKPAVERSVALMLLLLVVPLLVVVALAIWWKLGPGVLFRQQRVGLNGRSFTLLKFRTMLPDRRKLSPGSTGYIGPERRVRHKTKDDPRHTPLGRRLRRWSLDELPQLWNVVRGDMGLVGPRPELVEIVDTYEPWQHDRHRVRPGLTGLWQVTKRGENSGRMGREDTLLDLEYMAMVSPRVDVKILLKTLPAVFLHRGG